MVGISRKVALIWVLVVAAVAIPASAASASGTLTVSITGAGSVEGDGIKCSRKLGDSAASGDCEESYKDGEDCDPRRKPPCIPIPAFASVTADPATGFAFDRWTGACAGEKELCTIAMPENDRTTAVFRDAANPTATLTKPGSGPIAGTLSLEATAGDNVAVNRVEFRVRNTLVGTDTSAPYTASLNTTSIADGPAGVTATAVDSSGLTTTTSTVNVFVDNTKPALTVTGPNAATFGPGTTQSWTLGATDTNGSGISQVRCSLVASGSADSFAACSGGNGAHSVTGKPNGSYVLKVRATDNAGNLIEAVRTFAIDAIAPETTIVSGVADGASTSATTLTWAMSASEGGTTFQCRVFPAALTPGAFAPCSSGASHTASGFAPGVYTFEVRATDAVGNVEPTSAKRTFTVTDPPPAPLPGSGGGSGGPAGTGGGGPVAGSQITTVTTTTTTTVGAQIVVTLGFNFHSSKKTTKLSSLVVKNVPSGSTVKAKCSKGCKKKSFTKKNASGQVSLTKMIKKKKLKVNTKITVVVSKPGSSSAIKVLKIRSRKAPKVTTQCQPEGASKPTRC